ncbi:Coproporphyrinogen III oxidase [Shewanella benthica]|uniref:Coproporphyrinogen III oxidase n=2 Tax=Shewanella benthica TaxID=43661 RepID=A0A330M3U0_9GAMM|nr:Coproporphyrinogen III oxidase [Shewanella benthica]
MVLREIKKIQGNQIEAEKLSYRWEIDDYLLIFIHFVEGAHILPWLKSLI